MATGILERAEYAVVAPHDQHPVRAAAVLKVVAWLSDMVKHASDLPHFGPHAFDLELSELR
jgi:hypothetical protein